MRRMMLAALAVVSSTEFARAATISYAGAEADGSAAAWRTASVNKPFDIDGDDVYGTYAAVHWQVQGNYSGSTISFISSGPQYRQGEYSLIDHLPDNGATDSQAGIVLDEHTFEVNADLTGQILRVGVMRDVLGAGEQPNDQFKAFTLQQTAGGTAAPATSPVAPVGNGTPDMYFFDITDAQAGDRYQILASANVGGASNQAGYLASVTWDVAPVPEPTALALLGLGGLGLLGRRPRQS